MTLRGGSIGKKDIFCGKCISFKIDFSSRFLGKAGLQKRRKRESV